MSDEERILTLTPAACQHIQSIIDGHEEATSYRLSVTKTGCNGYMYVSEVVPAAEKKALETDLPLEGVASFSVYLDKEALPMVKGTTIDYVEKSFGMKQLVFSNPNAAGACGCGESFNLIEDLNNG